MQKKPSRRHPSAFFVCILPFCALLLGGCASQTTHQGMTPEIIDTFNKKYSHTVSLGITGGKQTESTGTPQISDIEFKQALLDAINKSKIFSGVIEGNAGEYLLTVTLFNLEQPMIGLSFTVKMEAGWTLKRISDGVVVWQESIESEHTATVGDAFAAVTRLRLATEGAARNNISQGLSKISKLGTI